MPGILGRRFEEARRLFNQGHYDALDSYFDEEIIMNKVDDPHDQPIIRKGDVINYLKSTQKERLPQLNVTHPNPPRETPDPIGNSALGQVTGRGVYQDNSIAYRDNAGVVHQPSAAIPVRYFFGFRKVNNSWVITQASAVPIAAR